MFVQLKALLIFANFGYRKYRKGLNSLFWKILFSNPVINKLQYEELTKGQLSELFFQISSFEMYYLVKPDNIDFIKATKSFQDGSSNICGVS